MRLLLNTYAFTELISETYCNASCLYMLSNVSVHNIYKSQVMQDALSWRPTNKPTFCLQTLFRSWKRHFPCSIFIKQPKCCTQLVIEVSQVGTTLCFFVYGSPWQLHTQVIDHYCNHYFKTPVGKKSNRSASTSIDTNKREDYNTSKKRFKLCYLADILKRGPLFIME